MKYEYKSISVINLQLVVLSFRFLCNCYVIVDMLHTLASKQFICAVTLAKKAARLLMYGEISPSNAT